jgi:hypothetical protein
MSVPCACVERYKLIRGTTLYTRSHDLMKFINIIRCDQQHSKRFMHGKFFAEGFNSVNV